MKNFWDKQALTDVNYVHSRSNLSYDKKTSIEKNKVEKLKIKDLFTVLNIKFVTCLEIGAGTCQWTGILSEYCNSIIATDTSRGMLEIGKKYMLKNYPNQKIIYYIGDICKKNKPLKSPYDLVFISGLLLYLKEKDFNNLIKFIHSNTLKDSIIILREPIGIKKEYVLDNVFSEELQTNYSAIYRTERKIIQKLKEVNFNLLTNSWVHEDGSKFNRWDETRLKLMSFRRNSK